MPDITTYESPDGRMLHRVGREGHYVRLEDYEKLEKRVAELEATFNLNSLGVGFDAGRGLLPEEKAQLSRLRVLTEEAREQAAQDALRKSSET